MNETKLEEPLEAVVSKLDVIERLLFFIGFVLSLILFHLQVSLK